MSVTADELLRGDPVDFDYVTWNGGSDCIPGRIVGKLAPRASSALHGTSWRYFVFVPAPAYHDKMDDPGIMPYIVPSEAVELEWGSLPEPGIPWLSVDSNRLTMKHGSAMRELFKKKGLCPRCGEHGEWKALALFCSYHGKYL